MKNPIIRLIILALLLSGVAPADLLKSGQSIEEARSSMSKAGYKKGGRDMIAAEKSHSLEFWSVGGGTLIATYSRKSNTIIDLSFVLTDERPKAYRKTFSYLVDDFDPATGRMTIRTKEK